MGCDGSPVPTPCYTPPAATPFRSHRTQLAGHLARNLGDAAAEGFRVEDLFPVRLKDVFLGLGDGLLGAVGKRETRLVEQDAQFAEDVAQQ